MSFKFKKIINTMFMAIVLILVFSPLSNAEKGLADKKAIILMLDEISLEDLLDSKSPNISSLIADSGIGLINTRAKSSVANRGSSYLSLGMGVRSLASTQAGLAFNYNEMNSLMDHNLDGEIEANKIYELYTGRRPDEVDILNLAIADIERTALDVTPNNQIGLLGKIARENNLKVGLLGNADFDKNYRESTLIAMDENGYIPYGNISRDLLHKDEKILGGLGLDLEKMDGEIDELLDKTDILFIDFGDSSRIQRMERLAHDKVREEQRKLILERADSLLGNIISKVNYEDTLIMIISPNPSKNMIKKGNFGLTPIILKSSLDEKGLLISDTTRRKGLVANFDFAPTIFKHFNLESQEFIGSPMQVLASKDAEDSLIKSQQNFLYIRKYRKIFHWTYIAFIIASLVLLYKPILMLGGLSWPKLGKYLSLTTLALPISMISVYLFGYRNIVFDLTYIIALAFMLGYSIDRITGNTIKSIGTISILVSGVILLDGLFLNRLMIISPLGSDAIAGGRFYGLGNDYMGILISSGLLAIYSIYQNRKLEKSKMAILSSIYILVMAIALSPLFGANMGGTLSAIFVLFLNIFIVLDIKISFKRLLGLGAFVLILILLLASLDGFLNPSPTHAGKAMLALLTGGGASKFIEIITIKLRQVFWNLAKASWNIVLYLQLILIFYLFYKKKKFIKESLEEYGEINKGFKLMLFACLIIFLFNDTGTIAAALALSNIFIPMGLILSD